MIRAKLLNRLALRSNTIKDATQNRSDERKRRLLLSMAAAMGSRGVTVATGLISIPLTIDYLGAERFGLWMTIITFRSLITFADFGIGSGLINAVARANGEDETERARESIATAFYMLAFIAATLAMIFLVAYPHVSWDTVFNVESPQAMNEAGPAIAVLIACLLVNMPLGTVERVQAGLQEGYRNGIRAGIGNLLGLAFLLIAIELEAGLPWLILAYFGGPLLGMGANWLIVFTIERPSLFPLLRHARLRAVRSTASEGGSFFVNRLANDITISSDNLVVAQILGAAAVAQYAIPARLFTLVVTIVSVAMLALWPAYAESIARGDTNWARRAFRRSLVLTFASTTAISVALVFWGGRIIERWVGTTVEPSLTLMAGLGVWVVLISTGRSMGSFLNTTSLRFRLVTSALLLATAVPVRVLSADMWGIAGMVWSMDILYVIVAIVPYYLRSRTILDRLDDRIDPAKSATPSYSAAQR